MSRRQAAQGTNLIQSLEERIIVLEPVISGGLSGGRRGIGGGLDSDAQRFLDQNAERFAQLARLIFRRVQHGIVNFHRCFHPEKLRVCARKVKLAEGPAEGSVLEK